MRVARKRVASKREYSVLFRLTRAYLKKRTDLKKRADTLLKLTGIQFSFFPYSIFLLNLLIEKQVYLKKEIFNLGIIKYNFVIFVNLL